MKLSELLQQLNLILAINEDLDIVLEIVSQNRLDQGQLEERKWNGDLTGFSIRDGKLLYLDSFQPFD